MDIIGQMLELDDHQLLVEFARGGSEAAFATLVARHVNLVYSVALRSSRNPDHAQEITQAVFIVLARKAGRLSPRVVVSGWLYQAARLTAANFVKGEIRRHRREQEVYMQSTLGESESAAWEQISPLLDDAMSALSETDRAAVVLRYFENKNSAEIGAALRMTEETARRRVNRALEKLRKFFGRRGVKLSTVLIAGAVSANSVQAAPAALAAAATVAAVGKGAAVSGSTLTLIQGTLKFMAWTKAKTAVVAGIAILLAAGTTTLTMTAVHETRPATPPDLQGAWEGEAEILGTPGVAQGEKARSRIVFQFFKTNGIDTASGVFIDTAPEPFQVTTFTYDYPSVRFTLGRGVSYEGRVNAKGTEIDVTLRKGNGSTPFVLKRTAVPDTAPVPLVKSDYAPRVGSALQGTWMASLGPVRIAVKIAEPSPGTFRAELDNLSTSWLGQPLKVTYNAPEVKLRVASGAGMFQGELRDGNKEMAGNWMQDGNQWPVTFKRADR